MKKTVLIIGIFAALILFASVTLLQKNVRAQKKQLTVAQMGKQGIFVGDRDQIEHLDHPKISPEAKKRMEDHQQDIKAIDDASKSIQKGISYFQNGDYDNALVAYRKAYATDPLSRSYIGVSLLIPTYEKLGRYDEAMVLLSEVEQKYYKGEHGAKKAQEIRDRLLAALNRVNLNQPRRLVPGTLEGDRQMVTRSEVKNGTAKSRRYII